jgi:dTMP kinase
MTHATKGERMLIVIEGGDGTGKSTVGEGVANVLGCELQHFPNDGGYTGRMIREYLAKRWTIEGAEGSALDDNAGAMAFQALQLANRMEVYPTLAKAAGSKKHHLVCVRYWQSGLVYGLLDGLPEQWLYDIHEGLPREDLAILLDVTAETSLARQGARGESPERYEGKLGFTQKVLQGYRNLWADMDRGHATIDARQSQHEVLTQTLHRAFLTLGKL